MTALLESVSQHTYWHEQYRYQQWDCTNMSAMVCTLLTSFGIEPKIVCGQTNLSDPGSWHATTKAKIDGKWRMIESTWPGFASEEVIESIRWEPWSEGYTLTEAQRYYGFEFQLPSNLARLLWNVQKIK